MSTPTSIYHSFAAMINEHQQTVSPAELHGLLLGRSCAGAIPEHAACLEDAGVLFDGEIPPRLQDAVNGLHEMQQAELANAQLMAVTLLLPDDDSPLVQRLQALSQWCQGFLSGFGSHAAQLKLSERAEEILNDLIAISQLDAEENLSADNSDEASYMHLTEYLRVTPVLLYTEFVKPEPKASNTEAIH